jgi:hypothetical protein
MAKHIKNVVLQKKFEHPTSNCDIKLKQNLVFEI